VLALGLAGAALTAVAQLRAVALGPALALSGAAYAALLLVERPPLDARAAGVAAALLLVGELTGWARELGASTRDEPGNAWRRPIWLAGAAARTLGLGWLLLAVADAARVEGLAVEAVGAAAALAALVLVRRLARG
jgi:hypothetical protein